MKYKDIFNILETIREAIDFLQQLGCDELFGKYDYLLGDILDGVRGVNFELFKSEVILICDVEDVFEQGKQQRNGMPIFEEINKWCAFIEDIVNNRENQRNDIDEKFVWLMDYVRCVDFDIIVGNVKNELKNMDRAQVMKISRYYQNYSYMWGTLDVQNEIYDVVNDRVDKLIKHRDDFIWLYNQLGDYRSKLVLVNMLYNWITYDPTCILAMKENNFRDYYDLDLLNCDENEVVVDIGAYTGDSTLDYIQTYRKYKKIYCYEITADAVQKMKSNLAVFDNIEIINKGVGAREGKMFLKNEVGGETCNSLSNQESENEVEVVTIDNDIKEGITLIKMDIEGGEREALQGCIGHIQNEHPKLLVCVYHNNRDIFELPKMIKDMYRGYKLFLRSNGNQWGPAEIVLFAL